MRGDPGRIPEAKNDFIFAAIGEGLRLLGTTFSCASLIPLRRLARGAATATLPTGTQTRQTSDW